jgi:hypothetical protein
MKRGEGGIHYDAGIGKSMRFFSLIFLLEHSFLLA